MQGESDQGARCERSSPGTPQDQLLSHPSISARFRPAASNAAEGGGIPASGAGSVDAGKEEAPVETERENRHQQTPAQSGSARRKEKLPDAVLRWLWPPCMDSATSGASKQDIFEVVQVRLQPR
jgi:hypothetical protein